jgi:hypothetical protein
MKKYLKIQSAGEIEIEAFTLIGASSKRNDETKIGYFGSGLKYSIASMLRNNIDFKIFQGENEIKFDVVEKTFRNEIYNAISVNGQETSMTTTMGGSDWDIAFAPIREIYSNALDEDENVNLIDTDELIGKSETTTIYIEKTEGVRHFFENFMDYFCDKNPNVITSNNYCTVYPKTMDGTLRLFRKGILCSHDSEKQSLFSYNSEHFSINESRVLSDNYSAKINIARGLKMTENKNLITDLINGLKGGNAGYFEHELDFSTYVMFSNVWHEIVKDKKFVPAEILMFCKEYDLKDRIILPKNLLLALFKQFEGLDVLGMSENHSSAGYVLEENASEALTDKIIDALTVLRETKYISRLSDIDIKFAVFFDDDILGLAEKGKIILSTKLIDEDIPYIAKIIIEENEHNRSGFGDKTRSFQNHLFKLYFNLLTEK